VYESGGISYNFRVKVEGRFGCGTGKLLNPRLPNDQRSSVNTDFLCGCPRIIYSALVGLRGRNTKEDENGCSPASLDSDGKRDCC